MFCFHLIWWLSVGFLKNFSIVVVVMRTIDGCCHLFIQVLCMFSLELKLRGNDVSMYCLLKGFTFDYWTFCFLHVYGLSSIAWTLQRKRFDFCPCWTCRKVIKLNGHTSDPWGYTRLLFRSTWNISQVWETSWEQMFKIHSTWNDTYFLPLRLQVYNFLFVFFFFSMRFNVENEYL